MIVIDKFEQPLDWSYRLESVQWSNKTHKDCMSVTYLIGKIRVHWKLMLN